LTGASQRACRPPRLSRAHTLVAVAALALPEYVIEVEAVAVI
jgi:hypothetical protein